MCLKSFKMIYSYLQLFYYVKKYYDNYTSRNNHDLTIIDNIKSSIIKCGAVTIKFSQWITPKLELIYLENNDIINENKPDWLIKMESFYENCPNHDDNYTKTLFNSEFNENFDDKYIINDIIGSGSMGQVYLVYNKINKRNEVMKVLHPEINEQISTFRNFLKLLLYLPCIRKIKDNYFPFDVFGFIKDFEIQSNLINEANHLLYFNKEYRDNQFIIIPELYRISSKILIMSYEEGVSFEKSKINEYQKDKIVNLFHLFIRTNQMLKNYNHGDLHPGNWKIKETDDTNPKLIIYDFGYCWSIEQNKFNMMGTIFFDTFEESDNSIDEIIDNLVLLMYYTILIPKYDKVEQKEDIRKYILENTKHIINITVLESLKIVIDYIKLNNLKLDPHLIQCFIMFIQGQKLFEKYGLQSCDKNKISDYQVYREKYLNILSYCRTYNIFPEHSEYIENKLNEKQLDINSIFDTIDLGEKIKKLALK